MVDPFQQAEREFLRLKAKLAVGRMTSEQFDAAVKKLSVRDLEGRLWELSPQTGNWKLHEQTAVPPITEPERVRIKFRMPRKPNLKLLIVQGVAGALVFAATLWMVLFVPRMIAPTAIVSSPTSAFIAAIVPTSTLVPAATPTVLPTGTPLPPTAKATATAAPTDTVAPSSTPTPTPALPTSTPLAPKDMIRFENPRQYRVQFALAATSSGFQADELRVYQARPAESDGQRVQVEEVSPTPSRQVVEPTSGNSIYYWQISNLPANENTTSFKMQFLVTRYETWTFVDPSVIQPYKTADAQYALYTRPERYIESNDPQIVELANQVGGSESNPYRLARKFYEYIIDRAQYKLTGRGLIGAKELLSGGAGECGDYAALFVALARAKGIPARPVVGYWAHSGLDQTHVWAEFYLEPIGWIPVDPTVGQSQPLNRNFYFGNLDNERVMLHKSYNIPLDPPLPNGELAPLLQSPAWWVTGKGDMNAMRTERVSWTVALVP